MDLGVFGFYFQKGSFSEIENRVKLLQERLKGRGVFLRTCSRLEFYFSKEEFFLMQELLWESGFLSSGYFFENQNAFSHLCRVASGLDSPLLGETEIKRQVKEAYMQAKNLPFSLHYFFQKALHLAKEVRCQFFSKQQPSLGNILLQILQKPPLNTAISFIGNSHLNRQIMFHFLRQGFFSLTLFSRHKGPVLLGENTFFPKSWDRLQEAFQADILIFASKLKNPLIFKTDFEKAKKIFDLGVPQNLGGTLPFPAQIYTLDFVLGFWQKRSRNRDSDKKKAERHLLEKSRAHYRNYEMKQACSISFSA